MIIFKVLKNEQVLTAHESFFASVGVAPAPERTPEPEGLIQNTGAKEHKEMPPVESMG